MSANLMKYAVWQREKSDHWWTYIVNETFSPSDWIQNFRVTKQTFNNLCDILRPYIMREDTQLRKCIPVEKRVGLTLWTLATNVEYRTIAHLFGVSITSVCHIVKDVCQAIHDNLADRYISLPSGEELLQIMLQFENRWGFPNCVGAVDGSHIPIVAPTENHTDYYNRKGFYSILLQAVVDCNYLFRDTCIGWPGKVHDARVLANSELFQFGQDGRLFPNERRNLSGVDVPAVILGDPAYPLLPWLMKPYPETARTTAPQYRFNYMLSRNRMVVECAFGRLKGRWLRLLKRMDFATDSVPMVISACCVLHNICEQAGDALPDDVPNDFNGDARADGHNQYGDDDGNTDTDADTVRDAFCRFFSENR